MTFLYVVYVLKRDSVSDVVRMYLCTRPKRAPSVSTHSSEESGALGDKPGGADARACKNFECKFSVV